MPCGGEDTRFVRFILAAEISDYSLFRRGGSRHVILLELIIERIKHTVIRWIRFHTKQFRHVL